ncbi:MAG: hypothetical protein R6U32_04405 [Candidatus Woesearchaeota archaeon]
MGRPFILADIMDFSSDEGDDSSDDPLKNLMHRRRYGLGDEAERNFLAYNPSGYGGNGSYIMRDFMGQLSECSSGQIEGFIELMFPGHGDGCADGKGFEDDLEGMMKLRSMDGVVFYSPLLRDGNRRAPLDEDDMRFLEDNYIREV